MYRAIEAGELRATTLRGRLRITEEAFEEWVRSGFPVKREAPKPGPAVRDQVRGVPRFRYRVKGSG